MVRPHRNPMPSDCPFDFTGNYFSLKLMKKNEIPTPESVHSFTATYDDDQHRIDIVVSKRFPSHSRSFFKSCFTRGLIKLNDKIITKISTLVKMNDVITVTFPQEKSIITPQELPKNLDIPILHIDGHFLIICKPAGLITHASTTKPHDATLVDWLLTKFEDIREIGDTARPGIVHRLDKNTSGIMVITRTNYAHMIFGELFKERKIRKTYLALVQGHPDESGTISWWIDRHRVYKHKMTHVVPEKARKTARFAQTFYKVIQYFENAALIECVPATGRTHQIRVHLAALGHPLLGDTTYGTGSKLIKRHALHAHTLAFTFNEKEYSFECPVPKDFETAIKRLKQPVS
ncbi:RluA family pseudouridine synthase [Candidatus Babeliales bacterium]|nr:RluA family pseudouridine synthase [Candidatus Babeliales bacterium]